MKSENKIQPNQTENQNENFCRFDAVVGLPTINVNEITLGDSLELCERIRAKTVDLILEDMPYNNTNFEWDCAVDFKKYWQTRWRILKDNGAIVLTAQQPFATDLINSERKNFRYEWIWEKSHKLGFPNANKMPLRNHENILIFYKKLPTYNPQKFRVGKDMMSWGRERKQGESRYGGYTSSMGKSIYTDDGTRLPTSIISIRNWNRALFKKSTEHIHPTEKPVELFEYFIQTYTNVGELVFDGFGGSGTTAVACHKSKRNFIVIEKEQKYFDLATRRLADERTQLSLL